MLNLDNLFKLNENILSIYFTAGFPGLNDTGAILKALEKSGVQLIELGMPYSDPLADGPVIQHSSEIALKNGMSLPVLFEQLSVFKKENPTYAVPIILMGYLNPVLQFGVEKFCNTAKSLGIDAVIIPDLTPEVFEMEMQIIFENAGIKNIFLITPQTDEARIRKIDKLSKSFIYVVSAAGVTGSASDANSKEKYFASLQAMNLQNPLIIGFGISTHADYALACKYASGAIIGSAFIRHLASSNNIESATAQFINSILH